MQPFRYTRPASLGDAVRAASRPGAVVIAGGTTVVDLMRADVLAPQSLVDVSRLAGLRRIETAGPSCASAPLPAWRTWPRTRR